MLNETDIVIVFGGSGFVGRYLLRRLARSSALIRVVGRSEEQNSNITMLGAVGQITCHKIPASVQSWHDLFKGATYVVNLIGILNETKSETFRKVHIDLASDIARHCQKNHIKRFIHIGALNNKGESNYILSKMEGIKAIKSEYPNATILMPSLIFGPEDKSLNMFVSLIKYCPIVPLIVEGKTKFQPIYVDDVAAAIEKCLHLDGSMVVGKTFEIAGKDKYSLKQLFDLIATIINKKRLFIPITLSISFMISFVMELVRVPLLTRDQVKSLKHNSVLSASNGLDDLGITPHDLHHVLKRYVT